MACAWVSLRRRELVSVSYATNFLQGAPHSLSVTLQAAALAGAAREGDGGAAADGADGAPVDTAPSVVTLRNVEPAWSEEMQAWAAEMMLAEIIAEMQCDP